MIEIELLSKKGFIYDSKNIELLNRFEDVKYKITNIEYRNNVEILTIDVFDMDTMVKEVDLLKIKDLKCKHGKLFDIKTIHRLPQEGWEELIDCWSCHDSEFKSMLDLKMTPRENGILVSNFYFIAHKNIVPSCCFPQVRYFFNETTSSLSNSMLVYKYFEEHFMMKNFLVLNLDGKYFEIKIFYKCVVVQDTQYLAFKVGFKETTKIVEEDTHIGAFFKNEIMKHLNENSLKIPLLGYELSFIILK